MITRLKFRFALVTAALALALPAFGAERKDEPVPPAADKTALVLDAVAKHLAGAIGGKWEPIKNNRITEPALQGIVPVVKDGRTVDCLYIVFLFPFDAAGRQKVLDYTESCEAPFYVLGTGGDFSVITYVPNDQPVSQAVTKALRLVSPTVPLQTLRLADRLSKAADAFSVTLQYHGPQDKPFYRLSLVGPKVKPPAAAPNPFAPLVQIDKDHVLKMTDHLVDDGFLLRAANIAGKEIEPPKGPTYTMTVSGPQNVVLFENLGWDLEMLERLEALRKVLDGDAAKAMDTLLARLEGYRKEWTAAAENASIPSIERELKRLNVTPDQHAKVKAWFEARKDKTIMNPGEYLGFLKSILDEKQKAILQRQLEKGAE